uniref:Uncharacterized protein n=1 Tax=Oryza punctata TaxID=4537 RepID=A0A0E0KIN2_ORYPU
MCEPSGNDGVMVHANEMIDGDEMIHGNEMYD